MKCEICGSENSELVSEKLRYPTNQKVYRCKDCGLVYIFPKMTPEEERRFYEREYGEIYSTEKGTTPSDLYQSRLPDAQLYSDWVSSYLSKTDNCLEIGCASGYFLKTIESKVNSISGIETHILLKKYCEDIGISMFNELGDVPDKSFDKIFLFFVVEHIGNPTQYLKDLSKKLKSNGQIMLVVPNVEDVLLSEYNIPAFPSFYYTPAHQYYYSRDTLSKLFEKVGFTNFEIKPIQRYDLSNHVHWMMNSKPGGAGKYNHIYSEELNKEYKKCLEEKFVCDTLFAIITMN